MRVNVYDILLFVHGQGRIFLFKTGVHIFGKQVQSLCRAEPNVLGLYGWLWLRKSGLTLPTFFLLLLIPAVRTRVRNREKACESRVKIRESREKTHEKT